jgi:rare lipoprotein A
MKLKSQLVSVMAVVLCASLLSGCAETQLVSHYVKKLGGESDNASAGNYKVGKAYQVGSVWYYPQEDFGLVETGIASWYGPDFHGGHTANGEIYDQNELTAAHRTLQMPSFVRVTNLENGRSVVVRVNDRGPYLHGRIIDVSKRAAELLDFTGKGTARVRLEVLGKESHQVAEAAKRGVDTSRLSLADLDKERLPTTVPPMTRGPQVASLPSDMEALPESLQTPTITVEELSNNTPGKPMAPAPRPQWASAVPAPASNVIQTHVHNGRVLPDPVVSTQAVRPTGIFVQAGSFSVQGNAQQLAQKLSKISKTSIEVASVNGRQVYRVKLGPVASVSQADALLEKVVRAGENGARVVRNK